MSVRSRLFPALLATASFVALTIGVFGFVSLLTSTDVIEDVAAGTLIGPVMLGVTAIAFYLGLLWLVVTNQARRSPVPVVIAVGLGCTLLYPLTGAIVQLFATGLPGAFVVFLGTHVATGYTLGLGASALLIAVGFQMVSLRRRSR